MPIGIGIIFLAFGVYDTYKLYILDRDGGDAVGEVVSFSRRSGTDGSTFAPNVRFDVPGGRTITFESSYSSSPPEYEIGEKVDVVYPLDAPQNAEIKDGGMSGKIIRIIFITGGVLTMLAGFGIFFSSIIKLVIKSTVN